MLERWFIERRKSKVLDMAQKQIILAIDTVIELEKSIKFASEDKRKEAEECIKRLFLVEIEVDNLRRAVFEELTRGSLPSNDREDIMHLVKRLDVMADHVKDSARNVSILMEADVPKDIWELYVKMANTLVKCASTLRNSIEALGKNSARARKLAEKVDQIEGIADEEYLRIKNVLLKRGDEMSSATLLMLKDLVDAMEHVADTCDDTADYIRILTVAR